MHELEIILALSLGIICLGAISDRIGVPYPLVLVVCGMIFGAMPFTPNLTIDPDLVLLVLLAPALWSAAISLDWHAFGRLKLPILELAIRLVVTTTVGVALVAMLAINGMDLGTAFVLGAIVSPPDALATISIVRNLRVPRMLTTLLEGESLVNDATALVLYRAGVAAVVSGSFSLVHSVVEFFWVAIAGLAIGFAGGLVVYWITSYFVKAPARVVALSIIAPFLTYMAAKQIDVSGVLAVVAAGLVTANRTLRIISGQSRIQLVEVWNLIGFLTEGFAFVLIGLELPIIITGIEDYSKLELAWFALVVVMSTILLRIIFVFWAVGGQWIAPIRQRTSFLSESIGTRDSSLLAGVYRLLFRRDQIIHAGRPSLRGAIVVSWAGLRGIVTLTTALGLPYMKADGTPFPHRNLIIFLAFCVILSTLIGQGATLPVLIRRLRFPPERFDQGELRSAMERMYDAGMERLDQLAAESWVTPGLEERVRSMLEARRGRWARIPEGVFEHRAEMLSAERLVDEIEDAQRDEIRRMADDGDINFALRVRLERQLDIQQLRRAAVEV